MSVHDDSADSPLLVPLPERAAHVPIDQRNTASPTRARFEYQDELAALIVLQSLTASDLEGVLVERATDLALIPIDGDPELISIKHQELIKKSTPGWSINDLVAHVLPDLHRHWVAMDRRCSVVFSTNAGFHGTAFDLVAACDQTEGIKRRFPHPVVQKLRKQMVISESEAEAFLAALTLDGGRPSRDHISASGVMAAGELLKAHRQVGALEVAETVYQELRELICDRSTDRSLQSRGVGATVAQTRLNRRNFVEYRQYLAAEDLLVFLLRVHDRATIESPGHFAAAPHRNLTSHLARDCSKTASAGRARNLLVQAATPLEQTSDVEKCGRYRHGSVRSSLKTKAEITVILPSVDVEADFEAIRSGSARWLPWAQRFEINERLWGIQKNGTVFPDSGPGLVQLSRVTVRHLRNQLRLAPSRRVLRSRNPPGRQALRLIDDAARNTPPALMLRCC